MSFPFRRKASTVVEETPDIRDPDQTAASSKGYTLSKRERGETTPRRARLGRKPAPPPPATKREAYRRMRARSKTDREERRKAMASGDERYMLERDRGPERLLVRNIVDYRLTVGTWFFAGALIVIFGSSAAMPLVVRFASNILWILLATATTIDCILLCRKVKRMMRDRFPKSRQRMSSLYFYAIMRSITFRRLRIPHPQIRRGEAF